MINHRQLQVHLVVQQLTNNDNNTSNNHIIMVQCKWLFLMSKY